MPVRPNQTPLRRRAGGCRDYIPITCLLATAASRCPQSHRYVSGPKRCVMGLYSLRLIAVPALYAASMVCAVALVLFHAVWDALQDHALAPTAAAEIVVLLTPVPPRFSCTAVQ